MKNKNNQLSLFLNLIRFILHNKVFFIYNEFIYFLKKCHVYSDKKWFDFEKSYKFQGRSIEFNYILSVNNEMFWDYYWKYLRHQAAAILSTNFFFNFEKKVTNVIYMFSNFFELVFLFLFTENLNVQEYYLHTLFEDHVHITTTALKISFEGFFISLIPMSFFIK